MSTYFTVSGKVTFKDIDGFKKAFDVLNAGGWVVDDKWLQSEKGAGASRKSGTPNLNEKNLTINFPKMYFRNLGQHVKALMQNGIGTIVWTSTDGMFSGGVCKNEGTFSETSFDLKNWWFDKTGENEPSIDDVDKYIGYQQKVEKAFLKEFASK